MATITVTNVSAQQVYLSDFYSQLDPAGSGLPNISRTFTRPAGEVPRLTGLIALLAAGTVTVTVAPTAAEINSGLLTPPQSVQSGDVAPVDAQGTGVPFSGRFSFTNGGSQDLKIFDPAAGPKFPGKKFRITKAWARITNAQAGSVLRLRSLGASGGSLLAEVGAAATGYQGENANTVGSVAVDMADTTSGLFLYKTDARLAGEIFWEGMLE